MTDSYRNISFEDSGPKITASDVLAFERTASASLPASYREFLLQINGGHPRPSAFKLLHEPAPAPGAQYEEWREVLESELERLHEPKNRKRIERDLEFWRHVYAPQRVLELHYVGGGEWSVEQALRYTKLETQCLPHNVVEIGRDDAECSICLAIDEPFHGAIFTLGSDPIAVDMNEDPDEFRDSMIAQSFEEFLDGLFPARILVDEGYEPPSDLWMALQPDKFDE